jgi:hypothetical protein
MTHHRATETDSVQAVKAAFSTVDTDSPVDFDGVYRRAARKRRARRTMRIVPLAAAAILALGAIPVANRSIERRRLLEEAVAYQTELIFSSSNTQVGVPATSWTGEAWPDVGSTAYSVTDAGGEGSWWLSPVDSHSY